MELFLHKIQSLYVPPNEVVISKELHVRWYTNMSHDTRSHDPVTHLIFHAAVAIR